MRNDEDRTVGHVSNSSVRNRDVTGHLDYVIAFTTCAETEAERIARTLVENKTCACVNIIKGVTSIYYWEDRVQSDSECILMIKTVSSLTGRVYQIIREHHSYQVPEFVVLSIVDGARDYLAWIDATCRQT